MPKTEHSYSVRQTGDPALPFEGVCTCGMTWLAETEDSARRNVQAYDEFRIRWAELEQEQAARV